jgi:hypothetical protein
MKQIDSYLTVHNCGGSSYNDYGWEDLLGEAGISLQVQRKKQA